MEKAQLKTTDKILIVCGQTATGKTKLAVEIAKKFDGELISADSRQIYKGLDIVTGKDLPKIEIIDHLSVVSTIRGKKYTVHPYRLRGIPIWLYDIAHPTEAFSVFHYRTLATTVISTIWNENKLPIIVGGTGLYIKSLLEPISTLEEPQNDVLRQRLNDLSVENLQKKLKTIDNQRWERMNASDRLNSRRLVRAIEIAHWVKVHTRVASQGGPLQKYDVLMIGLTAPIEELEKRIRKRVTARWNEGAVEEVCQYASVYSHTLPSSTALGFDVLYDYIANKITQKQAIEKWIQKDRQYAKNQMTWFKKQKSIHWFDIVNPNVTKDVVSLVSTWYT